MALLGNSAYWELYHIDLYDIYLAKLVGPKRESGKVDREKRV